VSSSLAMLLSPLEAVSRQLAEPAGSEGPREKEIRSVPDAAVLGEDRRRDYLTRERTRRARAWRPVAAILRSSQQRRPQQQQPVVVSARQLRVSLRSPLSVLHARRSSLAAVSHTRTDDIAFSRHAGPLRAQLSHSSTEFAVWESRSTECPGRLAVATNVAVLSVVRGPFRRVLT